MRRKDERTMNARQEEKMDEYAARNELRRRREEVRRGERGLRKGGEEGEEREARLAARLTVPPHTFTPLSPALNYQARERRL